MGSEFEFVCVRLYLREMKKEGMCACVYMYIYTYLLSVIESEFECVFCVCVCIRKGEKKSMCVYTYIPTCSTLL